jgi:hypothetical protein
MTINGKAYRVKPLEWSPAAKSSYASLISNHGHSICPDGDARENPSNWFNTFRDWSVMEDGIEVAYSIEEAKTICQRDHDARVMALLEPVGEDA